MNLNIKELSVASDWMMVWFHLLVEMLEILLEVFDVVASCWTSHNDLDVQVDKPSEHIYTS